MKTAGELVQNRLNAEIIVGDHSPMASQSDHKSFLSADLPACAVMENAHSDKCLKVDDCNHLFHSSKDREVIASYATAIGQSVAAAIWMMAKR